MGDRVFYRSKVTLTVLSDCPIEELSMERVIYEVNEGDMLLAGYEVTHETLSADEVKVASVEAGSDAEFFQVEDD